MQVTKQKQTIALLKHAHKSRSYMRKVYMISSIVFVLLSISCVAWPNSKDVRPNKNQWYLNDDENRAVNIGWESMWNLYELVHDSDKTTVRIAVIDTGADYGNFEIKDSLVAQDDLNNDCVGHGTKVIGIICASQYKGKVVGVSDSKYTEILPIKVTEGANKEEPVSSTKKLIQAIKTAETYECDICNICLNTVKDDPSLKRIMVESDMLFVVSAGNGTPVGRNIDLQPSYPASYRLDNMIVVTNIKSNGKLSSSANYGQTVDIAAPGTEIYNISLDNGYCASSGTSFATPLVTGIAAMIYIDSPGMTATNCKSIILNSAKEERRIGGKVEHNRLLQMDEALALAMRKGKVYNK